MVDMKMRVQHIAHVAELEAVFLQLVLDHVLVELQAAHSERFHDLVGAVSGVDQHRPCPAENEEAIGGHPARAAAIAPEHEEARFEFDIAVVEYLDFERHSSLPSRINAPRVI